MEDCFIFPFVVIGRIVAHFKPLDKEYRICFFFPFFHTGGAENVHAQISQATGGDDCVVFFTRKSVDKRYYQEFLNSHCKIIDISKYTDNKWFYFLNLIFRGLISGYANTQKAKPLIFNGQCNFAYKISPWLHKNISQVELIHSLNSFSFIRIPFLPFITKSIMISKKRIEDHRQLYKRFEIPVNYFHKIVYIPNGIAIPIEQVSKPTSSKPFTILYSGRGSKEKRIHLIGQIARKLHFQTSEIQFKFIGDVSAYIDAKDFPYIQFKGNLSDEKDIEESYLQSDVLLLTSDSEGFPMVVMEAMAKGCAIIATPVGDIPLHVKNFENGFLFSTIENENLIVEEAIQFILKLVEDRELLNRISEKNVNHARANFGLTEFQNSYRTLFDSLK